MAVTSTGENYDMLLYTDLDDSLVNCRIAVQRASRFRDRKDVNEGLNVSTETLSAT
jgi:hypothetical protein